MKDDLTVSSVLSVYLNLNIHNSDFAEVKDYLHKELSEIEDGKANFLNQSEFEKRLDQLV